MGYCCSVCWGIYSVIVVKFNRREGLRQTNNQIVLLAFGNALKSQVIITI